MRHRWLLGLVLLSASLSPGCEAPPDPTDWGRPDGGGADLIDPDCEAPQVLMPFRLAVRLHGGAPADPLALIGQASVAGVGEGDEALGTTRSLDLRFDHDPRTVRVGYALPQEASLELALGERVWAVVVVSPDPDPLDGATSYVQLSDPSGGLRGFLCAGLSCTLAPGICPAGLSCAFARQLDADCAARDEQCGAITWPPVELTFGDGVVTSRLRQGDDVSAGAGAEATRFVVARSVRYPDITCGDRRATDLAVAILR
jgi:hypothetical protein